MEDGGKFGIGNSTLPAYTEHSIRCHADLDEAMLAITTAIGFVR